MALADDIASDLASMDGTETVSLYDASANTTDATVTALRGPLSHREVLGGHAIGIEPKDVVFQLQANTTSIVPAPGDAITDSTSVVFNIVGPVAKVTLGTRWRCVCKQQE